MGLRRGRERRQNWRYSVLPHDWDADVNKYCIPSCSSCPSASPFWFVLSDFHFQKPWCSACMARKCLELDWKRSLWCPWCITHGSAGRGGTEWFHSLSDDKSHMNCGSLWGSCPRKHDIFSSESPKLMLVLWPLSWRRRKLPQEENVIAPGGKCHWKEKYQHYSFGERLQIWHRETEDCSNWADLDSTGRNSFFQWSLELTGKEKINYSLQLLRL